MAGSWSTLDLAGKLADVFDPPMSPPQFSIIYMHDIEQESLARYSVFTQLLSELRLGCVCPSGDLAWWSDRICADYDRQITAEKYCLEKVVPFVRERWGLSDRTFGVLGIGMGGQGALRIAFKYPDVFPVVAGISSAIEYHQDFGCGTPLDTMYDSKEQCRQDIVTLHIHPTRHPPHIFFCCDPENDKWHRGNDRLHEKLSALGVAHECDLVTRVRGDSWQYNDALADRVLHFMTTGLIQESRRLF